MAKFISKPVEIEAVQWHRGGDHPAVQFIKSGGGQSWLSDQWAVEGRQGWAVVHPGDWIITEPNGKGHHPCASDVFAAKYEPIP